MKRLLFAATLTVATLSAHAADVGVSVSIGQPGFYGHIDINGGGYPPPRILYREPMVVERVAMHRPPIYMRVPPGYARNWSTHCREYNACGERVYFVHNSWYQNEYAPRYQEHHRDGYDRRGNDHDDRGNNKHNNNGKNSKHGNGHGNKNGHGSNH
jgi:hypothetical protein